MSQYEYNASQWFFWWLRSGWRMPVCDVPKGMRVLDESKVIETKEAPWGMEDPKTQGVANDRLGTAHPWKPGTLQGGRAMQRAHSSAKVHFNIRDGYGGHEEVWLPAPLTGNYWVENNPRPLFIPPFWGMAFSNHYDKHIVLVDESQTWEVIGATKFGSWAAQSYGHFENNEIVSGHSTVWNKHGSMASRMLNRGEYNHVISVAMRGSDKDSPWWPWMGQRLALNLDKAPKPKNEEQELYLNQLATYGISVDDHSGNTGLSWAEGAQWNGCTIHQLDIRMWMFDEVTDYEGKAA